MQQVRPKRRWHRDEVFTCVTKQCGRKCEASDSLICGARLHARQKTKGFLDRQASDLMFHLPERSGKSTGNLYTSHFTLSRTQKSDDSTFPRPQPFSSVALIDAKMVELDAQLFPSKEQEYQVKSKYG